MLTFSAIETKNGMTATKTKQAAQGRLVLIEIRLAPGQLTRFDHQVIGLFHFFHDHIGTGVVYTR